MIDIVMPCNNEEEFIVIAEKLGYNALCFLYDVKEYQAKQKKFEAKKIKLYAGILADSRSINKVRNKSKNEKVFVAVRSSNNDREIMEKPKADMVFSFEESPKMDFIHQRASGLNHILCKIAKKNNIIIGFSLSSILNSKNKQVILGRIMQNIKLCRKFRVKTAIASFAQKPFEMRGAHDLRSLFEILGSKNPAFLEESDII